MKRFLLFASHERYDYGQGWSEFIDTFDTKRKAINAAIRERYDWYQVVDTQSLEIVAEDYCRGRY